MNTSDNFRSGRFNFRSTTGNVNLQFQNAGQDQPVATEVEEEFSKAELDAKYQEGFQACAAEKAAELDLLHMKIAELEADKRAVVEELAQAVSTQFNRLEQELCQETLNMALAINQELIRDQEMHSDELKKLLMTALQEVQNIKSAKIELSTEDYQALANDPHLAQFDIQENFQLAKSEIHIEHDHGLVNTKLEERLSQISEQLQQALDHDLHQE